MTTPPDIQASYERFKSFADKSEDAFFNHTDDYELICGLFEKEIQSPAPEQYDCDRVIRTLAEALDDCMAVVSDRPAGGRMLTKKRILEAGQTALSDPAVVKVMGAK